MPSCLVIAPTGQTLMQRSQLIHSCFDTTSLLNRSIIVWVRDLVVGEQNSQRASCKVNSRPSLEASLFLCSRIYKKRSAVVRPGNSSKRASASMVWARGR